MWPNDTCETLYLRAEVACIELLSVCMHHLATSGELPPPCGWKWGRKPITRKEFEEWLVVDPTNAEAMERKIRAARHSKFPGPYVMVNGHRFALAEPSGRDVNPTSALRGG
ncbi:MAG: hypothetical protein ACT4P2_05495 [Pseudomonadota bacterium]